MKSRNLYVLAALLVSTAVVSQESAQRKKPVDTEIVVVCKGVEEINGTQRKPVTHTYRFYVAKTLLYTNGYVVSQDDNTLKTTENHPGEWRNVWRMSVDNINALDEVYETDLAERDSTRERTKRARAAVTPYSLNAFSEEDVGYNKSGKRDTVFKQYSLEVDRRSGSFTEKYIQMSEFSGRKSYFESNSTGSCSAATKNKF